MIDCPNCGSFMRFDIESQQLKCDHCGSLLEAGEATKLRNAREQDDSVRHKTDVYEFVCPQCNGSVYGDERDLTGFCTYCGSPVELNGRLTKIENPKYIIPFRKTKKDCKRIFKRFTRLSPFLPSGFKDEAHVESFRGIYMPYYLYDVKYDAHFNLDGKGGSSRRGDYIYTKCYDITGSVEGEFTGFEHDASKEFANDISEALSPFRNEERVPFEEGYVSGFYAEAANEGQYAYDDIARELSSDVTFEAVKKAAKKKRFTLHIANQSMKNCISSLKAERALYPVWFMAYRHKDRVAYAAVNAQTGKMVADLPISIAKFMISTLLFTIPFYFILESLVTFTPTNLIGFFAIFMVMAMYYYQKSLKSIVDHEGYDYDEEVNHINVGKRLINMPILSIVSLLVSGLSYLFISVSLLSIAEQKIIPAIIVAICMIIHLFFEVQQENANIILKNHGVKVRGRRMADLTSLFMTTAAIVCIFTFVADYWYYGVCILLLTGVLMLLVSIVLNHNMLATRKPVQFDKKGGDDNA